MTIKLSKTSIFSALLLSMCLALAPVAQAAPGKRGGGQQRFGIQEAKGIVSAVAEGSVVVNREDGTQVTLQIIAQTKFAGPDRNGDGVSGLADIQVGDQAKAAAFGVLALAVAYKAPEVELTEVRGLVSALGADSVTLIGADGSSSTYIVDAQTRFMGPDRNGDGVSGLADIQVGDLMRAGANGTLLVKAGYRPAPLPVGEKVRGIVTAISANSIALLKRDASTVNLAIGVDTKIKGRDRNRDGVLNIADIQTGDLAEVRMSVDGTVALTIHAKPVPRGKAKGKHRR